MDEKLLANLDATRQALDQIGASVDIGKISLAAKNAAKLTSFIHRESILALVAIDANVLREHERMNAHVADAIGQSAALSQFTAASKTLLLSPGVQKLTRVNGAVSGALNSVRFDNLIALDRSLGRRLLSLSRSYRDIFAQLTKVGCRPPAFVTELPPRDMIVKSTIVRSRTVDFEPAEAAIALDDPSCERSDVDLMLADLNPDFVAMLDEAVEVALEASAGRARHACCSLRELLMHVLHRLAPDDEILQWTQGSEHYHEGRPTRQARVLYVCRHVNYGPYGGYLKKSVSATISFIDTLNSLHSVRPDICDFQLRLMLTDAIGILRFLLRTATHRPDQLAR